MRQEGKFLWEYIRQYRKTAAFSLLLLLTFWILFLLYHLPFQAAGYGTVLTLFWGALLLVPDYFRFRKKHRLLVQLREKAFGELQFLPVPRGILEEDYQELLAVGNRRLSELEDSMNRKYTDLMDYYTLWVHQIKTPIASMRLTLQEADSPLGRELTGDLMRIEQYVEMVLCYLRLDSDSTDYVFQEYSLDAMIRHAVKKFSPSFIQKKIRLDYRGTQAAVVTDEKWLLFVMEQILSNGLKYTRQQGCITIEVRQPLLLCIRDTGIGIAKEDLPRVFEKGYTGYNGRTDKKASGIGLYLCKRICRNLGHAITITSRPGEGTEVCLDLRRKEIRAE